MDEVSGEYRLGESAQAAAAYSRRLFRGPARFGFAVFLLGAIGFWFAAGWTSARVAHGDSDQQLLWDTLIVLLVVLPWTWSYLLWRKAILKRVWEKRGLRDPLRLGCRIEPDALVFIQPDQEIRLRWPGISEIAPASKHWMILAGGLCHVLPRRFFADAEQERAFIGRALEALEPDARDRSAEAAVFAAREP